MKAVNVSQVKKCVKIKTDALRRKNTDANMNCNINALISKTLTFNIHSERFNCLQLINDYFGYYRDYYWLLLIIIDNYHECIDYFKLCVKWIIIYLINFSYCDKFINRNEKIEIKVYKLYSLL